MKEQYKRTRVALNGIRDACAEGGLKERLFLSNSAEITLMLQELDMIERYPQLKGEPGKPSMLEFPSNNQNNASKAKQEPLSRSELVRKLIDEYIRDGITADSDAIKISALDIALQPF